MIKEKEFAPIAVFTYARLDHTKKMIESLLSNEESAYSDVYIFSDGAKSSSKTEDVKRVRDYLHTIYGFKSVKIIERKENWGLAKNLVDGITTIVKEKKRIIVLEDDLILSRYFLRFMNEALEVYEKDEKVSAISGFVNPVNTKLPNTFLLKYFACWGWATWDRAWNMYNPDGKSLKADLIKQGKIREFNIDHSISFLRMLENQINGINNSWAILFYASSFVNDKYILFPGRSLTKQNGIDGSGTHSGVGNDYDVELADAPIVLDRNTKYNRKIYYSYRDFYLKVGGRKAILKRLLLIFKLMKS